MEGELHIDVDTDGIHRVRGELDAHSAPDFEAALAETSGEVVVDLSEVGFADSSGLRSLLTLHQRLERDGGRLRIRAASPRVDRLLSITGLDDVFPRG